MSDDSRDSNAIPFSNVENKNDGEEIEKEMVKKQDNKLDSNENQDRKQDNQKYVDVGPSQAVSKVRVSLSSPELHSSQAQSCTSAEIGSGTLPAHGHDPNTQITNPCIVKLVEQHKIITHSDSDVSSSGYRSQNRSWQRLSIETENITRRHHSPSLLDETNRTSSDDLESNSTVDTTIEESPADLGSLGRLDYAKNQKAQKIKNSWSRIKTIYGTKSNSPLAGPSLPSSPVTAIDKVAILRNALDNSGEVTFHKHQSSLRQSVTSERASTAVTSRSHSIVDDNTNQMHYFSTLPQITDLSDALESTDANDSSPSNDSPN